MSRFRLEFSGEVKRVEHRNAGGGIRPLEHMSKTQRAATPLPFARWLVEVAANAQRNP